MDDRCIVVLMPLVLLSHRFEYTHIAVGGDGEGFRSIKVAINAAEEGDTIEIHSGIYQENAEKSIKEENKLSTRLKIYA